MRCLDRYKSAIRAQIKKVIMFFSLSTCYLLCKIKFRKRANSPLLQKQTLQYEFRKKNSTEHLLKATVIVFKISSL